MPTTSVSADLLSLQEKLALAPSATRVYKTVPARVSIVPNTLFRGSVLALTDFMSLGAAIFFAFHLWKLVNPHIQPISPTLVFLLPTFIMAAFASSGLYPSIGLTVVENIRKICRTVSFMYLLLIAVMFATKTWWADSRGVINLAWFLSLTFVPLGRSLCELTMRSHRRWMVPVLLIGTGATARSVMRNLQQNRILGYAPIGCIGDAEEAECEGTPVIGSLNDVSSLASLHRLQYAIVAMPELGREDFLRHLRSWSQTFPKLLLVPDLAGVASLWTQSRDLGGLLGLEIQHNLLNPLNQKVKRLVDICISGIGLIVSAPIIATAALLIRRASSGAPPIYSQRREGKAGAAINVLKLRTMFPAAEEMLQEYLDSNPAAQAEWRQYCKLKQDPRIIPGIGRFLRKTSLDELPQLWNVFKGEMSLVGPRPFPAYHNELFDPELRTLRTQVTPGLTGFWQVAVRSDGDLEAQASLDSYYIRNWSLWLDLYILIRTARAVIKQGGSY